MMALKSTDEISCRRKKFPVKGRNFLLKDDLSLHWTTFSVTDKNFLTQEDIYCQRKKLPVTGSYFLLSSKD